MTNWTLAYDRFVPEEEGLREALTSTGNGYFCTRGALAWAAADGVSYPGTYAHGGFNRETTIMAGVPVLNEDLVNLPNWLLLELRIEGEEAIDMSNVELLSYRHEYDIRNATVVRALRIRDRAGRETSFETRRFVSMADMHQAAMQWTITPENWSGRVEVISSLDGRVTNRGVARYRQLEGRHLDPVSPKDVRPRGHRPGGADPPVTHLRRRGGTHPRLRRGRTARPRSQPLPDAGLHPPGALLRGEREGARAHREDGRLLHLARRRHKRAAGQRREGG